jgi:hypothetical protein
MCLDWLHVGSGPYSPDARRPLLMAPLWPITIYGSPFTLPKFQMAPRLTLLIFPGPKKKEPRYACLSEPKSSLWQRIWAEVSSSASHFLHSGLSVSTIKWRCLVRVLCPVRRLTMCHACCDIKKNRWFQNVSKTQSDTGEIPKRTYTKKIKNTLHFVTECTCVWLYIGTWLYI